ncbi:hypothetical protein IEU95_12920 [Hoyosella rhizosphaerae]|uniref:Uncharacterized protein n=1 Tax=Hoyosella rhizosphaerae TaxID=1755582 RepID=A0A916U747_9ACTN|nr:hypothetical protein [Hoyosella rhizosphaerae]MBN4927739.1 hypothetical protein [Hoyosella rhizosphaerae]GGC61949.1 hypothetical protein GCM10011410_13040 [Hoyosella rhizosphaerae]
MTAAIASRAVVIHTVAGAILGAVLGWWDTQQFNIGAAMVGVAVGLYVGILAVVGATLALRREARRPSRSSFAWRQRFSYASATAVLIGVGTAVFAIITASSGGLQHLAVIHLIFAAATIGAIALISAALTQLYVPRRVLPDSGEHEPLY